MITSNLNSILCGMVLGRTERARLERARDALGWGSDALLAAVARVAEVLDEEESLADGVLSAIGMEALPCSRNDLVSIIELTTQHFIYHLSLGDHEPDSHVREIFRGLLLAVCWRDQHFCLHFRARIHPKPEAQV